MDFMIESFR